MKRLAATPGRIRAYHASSEPDLASFAPLSHFGTRAAALARARSSGKIGQTMILYQVELELGSVLRIPDLAASGPRSALHSWLRLVDHLHYDVSPPAFSTTERDEILIAAAPAGQDATAGTEALIRILSARGIDALAYVNQFEDPGSTSWIVLRPTQVRILHRSAI